MRPRSPQSSEEAELRAGARAGTWLVAALVVLAGPVACSDEREGPPRVVTGVVTEIDGRSLTEIESFTLKDGSNAYEVFVDATIDYGFPIGHLQSHRVSAAPVRVELEQRGTKLYALSIRDA
ncbi:MAG TPA: hypothetical protein VHK89_01640 [Actinomycetota bacterium]|nr:hypothetical protein [Actinomycetota bacterium]